MDSLTQAALGAACGEAVLGKKIGNRALAWGALFGTIPDLDIFFNPFLDNARELEWHRGGSHSLLIILLATFLLAKPLARLWKRDKISPKRAGLFVFLAWFTHVLIDCFTVYGTTVFWPFSDYRVGFNNLFIIDPLYTSPLLISLIWLAFLRSKKSQKKRTRILYYGLGISSAYVLFSLAAKFYVSSAFDADLARRNSIPQRRIEAPTPFNTLLWRSIADQGDSIWVGYRSIFDPPSKPIRWTVYPKNKDVLEPHANEREIKTLKWFSEGWWIARPHAQGIWLADLRFGETRIFDAKPGMVDYRFRFSWSFLPKEQKERIEDPVKASPNVKDTMKRLGLRIVGNTDTWEANPRLAGIPGSFPEPLITVD